MYYVYQVEGKKHVQMNFSTSASQHKETFVEEKKNDHGVFSSPNINPTVLGT